MRDEELIRQIQNGDASAMDKIAERYYSEIYRFLCRKLSDYNAAQDVTQTVFVKFAANFSHYSEQGKLRNYLFKLAANAGNDWFRAKTDFVSFNELQQTPSDSPTPESAAVSSDTAEIARHALSRLPGFQRDVIIMRFYHGLSFRDIARITGTSLSSAKSRYRQGMEKLKNLLMRELFYE